MENSICWKEGRKYALDALMDGARIADVEYDKTTEDCTEFRAGMAFAIAAWRTKVGAV